ncbi:MAG: winged helix-turn-helix transcriptional regulator [Gaiellaceae bacterium]|jgi:DNA-binding HxlR family transcriptional regulator
MEVDVRDFPRDACSMASTLEVIGERWTMHVLRESFLGVRRFEDYRRNIGVARNILSDRLNTLVAEGILRRELYSERPPRYEYRLTRKGIDLHEILIALMKWGNHWSPNPDGPAVVLRHRECGATVEPVLACPDCGEPVHAWDLEALPGPATTKRLEAGAAG